MEIACTYDKCTGCMACVNICPRNAIRVKIDEKGFYYPEIDQECCVFCEKCNKVCPQQNSHVFFETIKVYAMLAKDDELRDTSSSGGVFSLLAKDFILKGGVIYGAAFDETWRVYHRSANNEEQLDFLRTSKYVQSDIGLTFREIKRALIKNQAVLFVGTPCQVDGLRCFLGEEYSNLLTVDLLCHGVPSPGVYAKWIEHETIIHGEISKISFRKKIHGWKSFRAQIQFKNGDILDCKQNEGFMAGFLKNIYLRKSCYQCPYACTTRIGDITLGDYWDYQETKPEFIEDDDRGISLVMVNTPKGVSALKNIRSKVALAPRTIEDAMRGNSVLNSPAKCSNDYNSFWNDYSTMSWKELMERYVPPTPESKDPIPPSVREYYAIPYVKRHRKHIINCIKSAIVRKIKSGD